MIYLWLWLHTTQNTTGLYWNLSLWYYGHAWCFQHSNKYVLCRGRLLNKELYLPMKRSESILSSFSLKNCAYILAQPFLLFPIPTWSYCNAMFPLQSWHPSLEYKGLFWGAASFLCLIVMVYQQLLDCTSQGHDQRLVRVCLLTPWKLVQTKCHT